MVATQSRVQPQAGTACTRILVQSTPNDRIGFHCEGTKTPRLDHAGGQER